MKSNSSSHPAMLKSLLKDKPFMIMLFLGFIIRLIWCIGFPTWPYTDFMWYHTKATELIQGWGFLNGVMPDYIGQPGHPTAFRVPGYPATLAALYFFTGSNILAGKLLNLIFGLISILLLYLVCGKFLSRRLSLWCVALFVFSPLSIIYTGVLGSETLFTLLLLTCATFLLYRRNILLLGLSIGYLSLVRPIGIYFAAVVMLFLLLEKQTSLKKKLLHSLTVLTISIAVITPWLIRNSIAFGEPVYSTNGGYVIYVNNNPYATGSWSDPYRYPDSPFLKYKHPTYFDELPMHKEGKKLAMEWILDNPVSFLKLGMLRLANSYWLKLDDSMWGFVVAYDQWHPITYQVIAAQKLLYRPFYLIAWAGFIYSLLRLTKKKASPLEFFILLTLVYFSGMMFLLEGNSRYVFPLQPFLNVLFVLFLHRLLLLFTTNKNISNPEVRLHRSPSKKANKHLGKRKAI